MFERIFNLVAQFTDALVCWTIVHPYEGGLVLRMGKYHRDLKPGFNWIAPLHIEHTITEHTVPRTAHLHSMSTTTKDGKTIGFEAVITWRINDLKKSLLEVSSLRDALADCCQGVIGTELAESTWDDILHGKVIESLRESCRKQGWKWGVEVMRVQLTGVAAARNIRLMQDQYSQGLTVVTNGSEPS